MRYPWSRQSAPRRVLGQRVAVALPVGGAHERGDDLEVPLGDLGRLRPEVGEPEVDVELEELDPAWSLRMHSASASDASAEDRTDLRLRCDRHHTAVRARLPRSPVGSSVSSIRVGPARVPSREARRTAVRLLVDRGYHGRARSTSRAVSGWTADWAARARRAPPSAGIALSVHAPIAAFLGHTNAAEVPAGDGDARPHGRARRLRGRARRPPSGLPARPEREAALDASRSELAELSERLEAKGRAVPSASR